MSDSGIVVLAAVILFIGFKFVLYRERRHRHTQVRREVQDAYARLRGGKSE